MGRGEPAALPGRPVFRGAYGWRGPARKGAITTAIAEKRAGFTV